MVTPTSGTLSGKREGVVDRLLCQVISESYEVRSVVFITNIVYHVRFGEFGG